MIKVTYKPKQNIIFIDFKGKIGVAQSLKFLADIKKILPKVKKGFRLLTDLSGVSAMGLEVKEAIAGTMDLLDAHGVAKIIRVIPDPAKDIGFNILSVFHYSKHVKILTVESRGEAEERLSSERV